VQRKRGRPPGRIKASRFSPRMISVPCAPTQHRSSSRHRYYRNHLRGHSWDYRRASSVKNFGVSAANELNLSLRSTTQLPLSKLGRAKGRCTSTFMKLTKRASSFISEGECWQSAEGALLKEGMLKADVIKVLEQQLSRNRCFKTWPGVHLSKVSPGALLYRNGVVQRD